MASVGPLLLLLLMSYILISTATISTCANQSEPESASLNKLKESKEKLRTALTAVLKNTEDIRKVGETCLTLIKDIGNLMKGFSDVSPDIFKAAQSMVNVVPVVGSVFSLIMTLVIVIDKHVNDRSLLKDIKEEFDRLDAKLDQYHMEQKWNIWAAGVYHKPELDIRLAWTEYKTLLGSLADAKNDTDKRESHIKSYIKSYRQYEKAPREMGELLKKTGKSFINNLGDELAEHVKCHEKEILEYTSFILTLIIKGNMMNEYYYRLENTTSKARDDEMMNNVYEAMTAMFDIQKRCIANSMTYVLQDVKPLIDNSDKYDKPEERKVLAEEVWSFLNETYDRYDWMVVAFITKNSIHTRFKTLNKHVLTGFHNVSTQRITVAVARQVKGTHSKVQEVSNAIKNCLTKTVLCYKVAKTLSACFQKVEGITVNETYTAVHVYTDKAHQSTGAKKAQTPYIYTGDCEKSQHVKGGKFVVMIKSDEQIMEKDLCSKMECGEQQSKGTCVPIEDMFLAMCQCNYPHYGLCCENDINDYRKELEKEAATDRITATDRKAATDRKEPMVKDLRSQKSQKQEVKH